MPKKITKTKNRLTNNDNPGLSKVGFSIERVYNASVAKVWNAITNNDEIKQWYFNLPDFRAEIGFQFEFMAGKDESHMYKHICKITEIIERKKLAYSWQYDGYDGYSEVIFELFAEGSKTRLKLTHQGINTFPQDNEDFKMESFAEGWTITVDKILKEYVEQRKVILFNLITVDGLFEGMNHNIDWHNVDSEFNKFAIEQLQTIDSLIFGRVTYEMMASYWPTTEAIKDSPLIAKLMNEIPKLVFSKTLKKIDWSNSTLVQGDTVTEINKAKEHANKDIFIFGSGLLANEFLKLGLIDELRLIINPLLLGNGTPMFTNNKSALQLLKTRTFKNGNVLLYYKILKEK